MLDHAYGMKVKATSTPKKQVNISASLSITADSIELEDSKEDEEYQPNASRGQRTGSDKNKEIHSL